MVGGIAILQDRQVLLCAAALSSSVAWRQCCWKKVFIWLVLCYGNTTAHAAVITRDFLAIATMELVIVELLWEYDQGFWRNSWNLMSYGLEQVCLSGWQKMGGLIDHWNVGLAVWLVSLFTRVSQNICPFPLPSIDCNKWKHQTKARQVQTFNFQEISKIHGIDNT